MAAGASNEHSTTMDHGRCVEDAAVRRASPRLHRKRLDRIRITEGGWLQLACGTKAILAKGWPVAGAGARRATERTGNRDLIHELSRAFAEPLLDDHDLSIFECATEIDDRS
jgi:hypothetical protein